MDSASFAVALGTAAWLGILTSISPCPLATNVAAIAFVSRDGGSPRRALAAGLLYTLGRSVAYVALAAIAVLAVGRLLSVSSFLQETFYKLLGPLLIVVGMVLVGLIDLRLPQRSQSVSEERVRRGGLWAALPLGAVFALSFCPVSAALFFGMLIPLASRHESVLTLPTIYGVATGLPVALFAVTIAFGLTRVSAAFRVASRLEHYARPATGIVLIVVGIYESMRSVFLVL
ncbi:MAG: aromatic aminobenezylarsenical efflux permease ArsG family transporter [Thermoanaerobaculia bacterium]